MIALVGTIVFVNLQGRDVRAETFGQQSVLYSVASLDDSQTIEVVQAGDATVFSESAPRYFGDMTLDQRTQFIEDLAESGIVESDLRPTSSKIRTGIETYVVQEGDSLGKISLRFNLSISTILTANNLSLKSTIRPGDEIKILPEDGILYSVRSGDTLSRIAEKYKIEAADINTSNQLDASAPLKIGMQLLLPGATEIAIATAPIKRVPVGIKSIIAPAPTTKSTGSNWVWPTNWHVITQYYGWRHTGIDIDGDYSTFSIAAHEGVVSFTGWRNGYGLTVEMDHGNGLKTRYAHNSKIYVSKGDVVAAGGRLAQTGTTGNSTGTHLHFEVLLNGQFQNPLSYVR